MYIVIICFPVYDVMNFEINLSFFIKPFPLIKKVKTKNLLLESFRLTKSTFHHF